jgi:uncharacterized protein (TIGR03067 family)
MRIQFRFAMLFLVGVVLGASVDADEASKEAIAKDRAMIKGKWAISKLVIDGKKASNEDLARMTVVNEANGDWRLMSDGDVVAKGTSTLDPSAKPKAIDFVNTMNDEEKETYEGIYQLGPTPNERMMCFAPADKPRPAAFESESGTGHILVVFQRLLDQKVKPSPLKVD